MGCGYIPIPDAPVHLSEFMLGDLRRTGVYFLYHQGELVYVGQTRTLKLRLEQHLAERRKVFDAVAFIPCTVDRLTKIEGHYIAKYAPKYNSCGIAKRAREEHSWRRSPLMGADATATIDADEIEFNLYEAAEFLNVEEGDVAEWRKAGLLPDFSLIRLLDFAAVFGSLIRQAHSKAA